MIDLAIEHLNLAGRAQTMAAGVRQVDPRPQGCIENGLTFLDIDGFAQRLDGELVAHVRRLIPRSR